MGITTETETEHEARQEHARSEKRGARIDQRDLNWGAILRFGFAVLILAAFVTFAIQNATKVEVTFMQWDFQMPQFILMLASAFVGVVTWGTASRIDRRRRAKN